MVPSAVLVPGQPRTDRDRELVQRFDQVMRLPIVVSALLPLIIVPESGGWLGQVIGVATWLVFLADLLFHLRHLHRYTGTGLGKLDVAVVVATAPWFLIPGLQVGRFVVLFRLARLLRLVVATKGARRLLTQLGRVAAFAVGVTLVGSLVAYYAEHPTNPEFATVGDALWWGIVTLTTVGYGDIVPKTAEGRWAAVAIMITGIAVLGLLSGSLASFFRLSPAGEAEEGDGAAAVGPVPEVPGGPTTVLSTNEQQTTNVAGATGAGGAGSGSTLEALVVEVQALRREVESLASRLAIAPPRGSGAGAPGQAPEGGG